MKINQKLARSNGTCVAILIIWENSMLKADVSNSVVHIINFKEILIGTCIDLFARVGNENCMEHLTATGID